MPIFALVDCNNFYASCEKLFDPKLIHTPVVVLSNNDGCVVARSAEVKALGIPMGVPWFKLKDVAKKHGIVAFSSNYALYADMSNRVVEILGQYTPNIEVYSIDESFLDLTGFAHLDLEHYGQEICQRIQDWLGLGVCAGIAPTKTLAKLANHCAKKRLAGRGRVCDFTTMRETELSKLFSAIQVGEVWGVGRQINTRLQALGIQTVRDLRDADAEMIRSRFSVVLARTVRELHGVSCLDIEEVVPDKQQIMCSRSFGQYVTSCEELETVLASYIGRAAEKLRAQDSLAGALMVFVRTNPFSLKAPQYQRAMTVPLPEATSDTRILVHWGLRALKRIYRAGFDYQKAGVMLSELRPRAQAQASLFAAKGSSEGSDRLMATMDLINQRWGRSVLRIGTEGTTKSSWQMRRENLSAAYTTDWDGLPPVLAR